MTDIIFSALLTEYVRFQRKEGYMTLVKKSNWPSLFNERWLTDFFDNDRFFDADWMKRTQFVPPVNVKEMDKMFEIEVAAPGLTKKDFNINIESGILTISAEKKTEKEEKKENYTRSEFNYTSFSRSFNLPDNVDPDTIDAKYEDGVLRLTIQKVVELKEKPKAIVVH
jgi:HSP20 family protein